MDAHDEHCRYCEKFILELEAHKELDMLLELPNTYNPMARTYEWRDRGNMAYALVPQSIHGHTGTVDVYICVDEDDLDDFDVTAYTTSFLKNEVLPSWGNFKEVRIAGPSLAPPLDIGCWRKHEAFGAHHV